MCWVCKNKYAKTGCQCYQRYQIIEFAFKLNTFLCSKHFGGMKKMNTTQQPLTTNLAI